MGDAPTVVAAVGCVTAVQVQRITDLETQAVAGRNREPNCTPDETRVDAHGLVHDWAMVGEDRYGSHYECRRCHVQDVD